MASSQLGVESSTLVADLLRQIESCKNDTTNMQDISDMEDTILETSQAKERLRKITQSISDISPDFEDLLSRARLSSKEPSQRTFELLLTRLVKITTLDKVREIDAVVKYELRNSELELVQAELDEQNKKHKDRIKDHDSQIRELQDKHTAIKEELETAKQELVTKGQEFQAESIRLQKSLEHGERQLLTSQQNFDKAQSDINEVKSDLGAAKQELAVAQQKLAAANRELAAAKRRVQSSHEEFNKLQQQAQEKEKGLKQQLLHETSRLRSEKSQVEQTLHNEAQELEQEIRDLKMEISAKDGELENQRQAADTNVEVEQALRSEAHKLEREIQDLKTQVSARDDELESQRQAAITSIQVEEALRSEAHKLEREVQDLQTKISDKDHKLESQRQAATTSIQAEETLRGKVQELEREISRKDHELENQQRAATTSVQVEEALRGKVQELEREVENLKRVTSDKDEELEHQRQAATTSVQIANRAAEDFKQLLASQCKSPHQRAVCWDGFLTTLLTGESRGSIVSLSELWTVGQPWGYGEDEKSPPPLALNDLLGSLYAHAQAESCNCGSLVVLEFSELANQLAVAKDAINFGAVLFVFQEWEKKVASLSDSAICALYCAIMVFYRRWGHHKREEIRDIIKSVWQQVKSFTAECQAIAGLIVGAHRRELLRQQAVQPEKGGLLDLSMLGVQGVKAWYWSDSQRSAICSPTAQHFWVLDQPSRTVRKIKKAVERYCDSEVGFEPEYVLEGPGSEVMKFVLLDSGGIVQDMVLP